MYPQTPVMTRGSASVSIGPRLQTSSHSPYGRVSHCTVFTSSLLPMGPLTYTHFFLLKKYQGKIKTDVDRGRLPVSLPQGKPPVLLRTGERGQRRSHEGRSWERNQDLHVQRSRTWALGWGTRTSQCFGVTLRQSMSHGGSMR